MIPMAKISVDNSDIEALTNVLKSGQWAAGREVMLLEKEFSELLSVKHTVAVCNGTVALHAALLSLGIGKGDVVLTTPFTFIATVNAIHYTGAKPVYCDIDIDTFVMDMDSVNSAVEMYNPKAILCVHLFGHPCNMSELRKIASRRNIPIVEDCAQSHGAKWKSEYTGSLGTVGAFSLYATKNLPAGEGGLLTTNDDHVAKRIRRIINHGRGEKQYEHTVIGYNYRMSDIHACIARTQLKKMSERNNRRRSIAEIYRKTINNTKIKKPVVDANCDHVFHQYTLRCDRRNLLSQHLRKNGIATGIFYPLLAPEQECYRNYDTNHNKLRNAKECAESVISIPIYPSLDKVSIERIVQNCNSFNC